MKSLKQLKPHQHWAIIFGGIYLTMTISVFILLDVLGIQGEARWAFSVFLLPSLLIGLLLPDWGPRINMLIFIFSILLNAMLYATLGMLIGALLGRKTR